MTILFVIDAVHETGGAHVATRLLIQELLKRGHGVAVLGCTDPTQSQREKLKGVVFYRCYHEHGAWGWIMRRLNRKLFHCGFDVPWILDPLGWARRLMRRYDVVCVMSEGSIFRRLVGSLPQDVRKVQLIHTNYPMWARRFGRDVHRDGELYSRMDAIGCVGKIGADQFATLFPDCANRVFAFHNVIDQVGIVKRDRKETNEVDPVHLISLTRINDMAAKDGPRMIRIARQLRERGINFIWDVYGGGGRGLEAAQGEVIRLRLDDVFRIHGHDPNVRSRFGEADVCVLLSHYEGLPNSIYEALIAGVPVFATAVGGIPEQVQNGLTGWLVDDDETQIVERLVHLLKNPKDIGACWDRLRSYNYDTEKVFEAMLCHLKGGKS